MTPQEARDYFKKNGALIEEAQSALDGEEEEIQQKGYEEEFEENWEKHASMMNDKRWELASGSDDISILSRFPASKFPRPVIVHHEKELT